MIDEVNLATNEHELPETHLIRISDVFSGFVPEILDVLGASKVKRLGVEYLLIQTERAELIRESAVGRFVRFHVPVEHAWPCNPERMEGFIEKATQAMFCKFAERRPQTIIVGQLDGGTRKGKYRAFASNLRGRALQVFDFPEGAPSNAEEQDVGRKSLFCLVGKEGLYCGMTSPLKAGGIYAGGTKYIAQNADDVVSRAGAKLAEGLHFLKMYRELPQKGAHWLELGAAPGGITSELLKRGYEVTAVDRAALDAKLLRNPKVNFVRQNVAEFVPPKGVTYDAFLSDLNGSSQTAMGYLTRLKDFIRPGGLTFFTLKTSGAETMAAIEKLESDVVKLAEGSGFALITRTHLTYNRAEFTLFFEKI